MKVHFDSKKCGYVGGILILCFFLIHNFFFVEKYVDYPWYHIWLNDVESANAGQTVAILNNGELYFILHPGATVFTIHGTVYRILSWISPSYQKLMHLSDVKNLSDPLKILDLATRTSRVIALGTSLLLLIVIFALINQLTTNLLISFLFTFYIITSPAFLIDYPMVRAETPNLLFFFGAVLFYVFRIRKNALSSVSEYIKLSAPIGVMIGLSAFAKLKTGPAIEVFLGVILFQLFQINREGNVIKLNSRNLWFCLSFSLINLILMPWWALKRPAFLTIQYLQSIKGSDYARVYSSAPDGFIFPVLSVLLCLVFLSILLFVLMRLECSDKIKEGALSIVLFFNLFVIGLILAIYMVFLPISASFSGYIENTRHLVYSFFTHVLSYQRVLVVDAIDINTIKRVITFHTGQSNFLNINIIFVLVLTIFVSFLRLLTKSTTNKKLYILANIFIITGFILDILASMRLKRIFINYGIYSTSFYGIGLALFVSQEFKNLGSNFYAKGVRLLIIVTLFSHVFLKSYNLLTKPRASGISTQSLLPELLNSRAHGTPFWRMAEESIGKNK